MMFEIPRPAWHRHISRTVLFVVLAGGCGSAPPPAPKGPIASGASSLVVVVDKVEGKDGHIRCAIFDAPEGFPGPSPIRNGNVVVTPTAGAKCEFPGLAKGTYAVTVYHDANDNGVIDTNVFGAPTEGYGATNNNLPSMSAPTFADSAVALKEGQAVTSSVTLRY